MTNKTAMDNLEPLLKKMNEKLRDASMYQRRTIELPMMELVQLVGAASRALAAQDGAHLRVESIPMTEETKKLLSVTRDVSIPGVHGGDEKTTEQQEDAGRGRALIDAARAVLLTHYSHVIDGATQEDVEAAMVRMRIAADAADRGFAEPAEPVGLHAVVRSHICNLRKTADVLLAEFPALQPSAREIQKAASELEAALAGEPPTTELAKYRAEQLRLAAVALRNAEWIQYAEEVERAARSFAAYGSPQPTGPQKSKATLIIPAYLGNVKTGLLVDGLSELLRDVGGMKVENIDVQMPSYDAPL